VPVAGQNGSSNDDAVSNGAKNAIAPGESRTHVASESSPGVQALAASKEVGACRMNENEREMEWTWAVPGGEALREDAQRIYSSLSIGLLQLTRDSCSLNAR